MNDSLGLADHLTTSRLDLTLSGSKKHALHIGLLLSLQVSAARQTHCFCRGPESDEHDCDCLPLFSHCLIGVSFR